MPTWDHIGSSLVRLLSLIPCNVQDWPCCCLLTFILRAAPFDLQNCFGFCWFVPALYSPLTQQAHSCLLNLQEYLVLDSAPNPQRLSACHPVTHSWAFLGGLF